MNKLEISNVIATNIDSWKDQLGEWQSSIDYELTLDDYKNK